MEALDEPSINEFNAAQYSFFGDGPSIAAGALEAEGLPDDGLDVDDEDLSLATMLRNQAVEDITD
ncbi:hypothetical protein HaLaN_05838, partial [Haematococcus lacustris]